MSDRPYLKLILGLIIGGIALISAIIWIGSSQEMGLSFEMLEP